MDITTIVIGVVVVLCVATGWVVMRKDKADAAPVSKNIALRDSAAIALTHYWSHHHEDWSLALFRDGREVARQAGAMDAAGIVRWVRSQP